MVVEAACRRLGLKATPTCSKPKARATEKVALVLSLVLVSGCGAGLNQTSVTCPKGRTLLDGVCVTEGVADYVACVRAQGASLDAARSESISAEAGYLGTRIGAARDLSEILEKKYSVSDQAMMEIIRLCNTSAAPPEQIAINIDGNWTTQYGTQTGMREATIQFRQNGATVTAIDSAGASYEGQLNGRKVSGMWSLGEQLGRFEYIFSDDGQSFVGRWGNGNDPMNYSQSGKRLQEPHQ
jgi:hypothetical protein